MEKWREMALKGSFGSKISKNHENHEIGAIIIFQGCLDFEKTYSYPPHKIIDLRVQGVSPGGFSGGFLWAFFLRLR